MEGLKENAFMPKRNTSEPLLMYVDHCFSIKGQGTICTGTVMQGQLSVNETIEIPLINEQRKVKSMQMFRQPVQKAEMGDRVGLCVTQFNAKQLERGLLTKPGYLQPIYAACICLQRIAYYKQSLKSKGKLHVTIGHDTVMANITLFKAVDDDIHQTFETSKEYVYVEELDAAEQSNDVLFVLLQFKKPIWAPQHAILIASKLDMDVHSSSCRLAFWGQLQWTACSPNYAIEQLTHFRVYKNKLKQGSVQRLVSNQEIIVQNLFKKAGNRDVYLGKRIELSTGEQGVIASTFGQTSKVKITFSQSLKPETLQLLSAGRLADVLVLLKFKKYVFNKDHRLLQ